MSIVSECTVFMRVSLKQKYNKTPSTLHFFPFIFFSFFKKQEVPSTLKRNLNPSPDLHQRIATQSEGKEQRFHQYVILKYSNA